MKRFLMLVGFIVATLVWTFLLFRFGYIHADHYWMQNVVIALCPPLIVLVLLPMLVINTVQHHQRSVEAQNHVIRERRRRNPLVVLGSAVRLPGGATAEDVLSPGYTPAVPRRIVVNHEPRMVACVDVESDASLEAIAAMPYANRMLALLGDVVNDAMQAVSRMHAQRPLSTAPVVELTICTPAQIHGQDAERIENGLCDALSKTAPFISQVRARFKAAPDASMVASMFESLCWRNPQDDAIRLLVFADTWVSQTNITEAASEIAGALALIPCGHPWTQATRTAYLHADWGGAIACPGMAMRAGGLTAGTISTVIALQGAAWSALQPIAQAVSSQAVTLARGVENLGPGLVPLVNTAIAAQAAESGAAVVLAGKAFSLAARPKWAWQTDGLETHLALAKL